MTLEAAQHGHVHVVHAAAHQLTAKSGRWIAVGTNGSLRGGASTCWRQRLMLVSSVWINNHDVEAIMDVEAINYHQLFLFVGYSFFSMVDMNGLLAS